MASPAPTPLPRPAPSAPRPASGPTQTAKPAAAPAAKPSRLGAVVSGPRRDPKLWWFYGDEGIGKSSLAADAPVPIFLDIEGRTRHLHVARYNFRPDEGDEGTVPRSLTEIEDALDDLITNKEHPFKTVVLDGLASLEALIFARIVDEAKARGERNKAGKPIENIEDFGFSSGQKVAAQHWRSFLKRLEDVRFRRGMHVILLGHAEVDTFKNPKADDFGYYRPRIDVKAAAVLLEKADVVGFVTYDDKVTRTGRKAIGTAGNRVIYLEHSPTYRAKCSLPMPASVDLAGEAPWRPFADALDALYSMSAEGLRDLIDVELARLGEHFVSADERAVTATAMRAAVEKAADNTVLLHRYLTGLQQSSPATPDTTEAAP